MHPIFFTGIKAVTNTVTVMQKHHQLHVKKEFWGNFRDIFSLSQYSNGQN